MSGLRLIVGVALLSGCASSSIPEARFANQPIVWRVNDRRSIPEPKAYERSEKRVWWNTLVFRRFNRFTEFPDTKRAMNVNALGEVPNSTWFTNRIGMRELSIEEIERGPNRIDVAAYRGKWTIRSTKVGGGNPGFIAENDNGGTYILKLSAKGISQIEARSAIVTQRLIWAFGFNVPEDTLIEITPDQVVIPDGAVVKDVFGNKSPFTAKAYEEVLGRGGIEKGEAFTVLASRFLDGKPKGGFEHEGVREDDPNDVVPHQHRRELRGSRILFGWLQHTDIKPQNSIDMYTEDPIDADIQYLVHYWVDFGLSLGTFGHGRAWQWDGYAHTVDLAHSGEALVTFGLYEKPWERTVTPDVPEVGHFSSEYFDIDEFKAIYPFLPHENCDRLDSFWATKILMRFSPEHIRTAVEQGGYPSAESVDYLTTTLIERQQHIGRVWLNRLTALDTFRLDEDRLCMTDLLTEHRLNESADSITYRARAFASDRGELVWTRNVSRSPSQGAEVCMANIELSPNNDGYTILELSVERPGRDKSAPPVWVHLARERSSARPRVIGVWRE